MNEGADWVIRWEGRRVKCDALH